VCFGNITQENLKEKISELKKLYNENKEYIVAIGECGIDVHYENGAERIRLQQELFKQQCLLAKEL
jgi:Tat protein secretion system quality control protein TatD with DNase activity